MRRVTMLLAAIAIAFASAATVAVQGADAQQNCWRCQSDGWCSTGYQTGMTMCTQGAGWCDSWGSECELTALDGVGLDGTVLVAAEADESSFTIHAVSWSSDGIATKLVKRACNGAVVAREYTQEGLARVRESVRIVTLD